MSLAVKKVNWMICEKCRVKTFESKYCHMCGLPSEKERIDQYIKALRARHIYFFGKTWLSGKLRQGVYRCPGKIVKRAEREIRNKEILEDKRR